MSSGSETVASANSERLWTIPNTISYVRVVVLLPLSLALIATGRPGWALLALFFTESTDALDGYLARRLGQVSELGKELDPVADRISVALIAVTLTIAGLLPWYFLATILLVDLTLAFVAAVWFKGYPTSQTSMVGKLRTALLMLGLPGLLLAATLESEWMRIVALVLVALGTLGHVIAGIGYLRQMSADYKKNVAETKSPSTARTPIL